MNQSIHSLLASIVPTQDCIPSIATRIITETGKDQAKAEEIANLWATSIRSIWNSRQDKSAFLTGMIYLANDVVQKDRLHKVTGSYILLKSFEKCLVEATKSIAEIGSEEVIETFRRVIQIWKGSKIYKSEFTGRLMDLISKQKGKDNKGIDAKLVEPYTQLVELKRAKDPLYKEIQRYVECKRAMESLQQKRKNCKLVCERLLLRLEHAEMSESEMKNGKIELECGLAELERVLQREEKTVEEWSVLSVKFQRELLKRHSKELGVLKEGREREE